MAWDVFSLIGTCAFAIAGAIVAMEIKYDLFGVYILGIITAFGGGAVRNLLIGADVSVLWDQGFLFTVASVLIAIVFFAPKVLLTHWERWGVYFDAVGLAAFAIQGAMHAIHLNMSVYAVMVAAVLTGAGGGVIRDLFAGRKPLIFRAEIYASWAVLAGLLMGLGIFKTDFSLYILLMLITALRILSFHFHWQLPHRKMD